jgi:hypothetical protein
MGDAAPGEEKPVPVAAETLPWSHRAFTKQPQRLREQSHRHGYCGKTDKIIQLTLSKYQKPFFTHHRYIPHDVAGTDGGRNDG